MDFENMTRYKKIIININLTDIEYSQVQKIETFSRLQCLRSETNFLAVMALYSTWTDSRVRGLRDGCISRLLDRMKPDKNERPKICFIKMTIDQKYLAYWSLLCQRPKQFWSFDTILPIFFWILFVLSTFWSFDL